MEFSGTTGAGAIKLAHSKASNAATVAQSLLNVLISSLLKSNVVRSCPSGCARDPRHAHAPPAQTRKRRHPARFARRRSNLDFGRSWRRALAQAGHVRVIARKKYVDKSKRYDKARSLHSVASDLRGAHCHEEAILGAIWHRRLFRQHGMLSDIAIAASSSIAAGISAAIAIEGLAIGVKIKPTTARSAKRRRIGAKSFTCARYHKRTGGDKRRGRPSL